MYLIMTINNFFPFHIINKGLLDICDKLQQNSTICVIAVKYLVD